MLWADLTLFLDTGSDGKWMKILEGCVYVQKMFKARKMNKIESKTNLQKIGSFNHGGFQQTRKKCRSYVKTQFIHDTIDSCYL